MLFDRLCWIGLPSFSRFQEGLDELRGPGLAGILQRFLFFCVYDNPSVFPCSFYTLLSID